MLLSDKTEGRKAALHGCGRGRGAPHGLLRRRPVMRACLALRNRANRFWRTESIECTSVGTVARLTAVLGWEKIKVSGPLSVLPSLFNWQSWKCSLGCQLLWLRQCVCLGAHGLLLVRFRNEYCPNVFCHLQGSLLGSRSASFNQHILINYLYLLAF